MRLLLSLLISYLTVTLNFRLRPPYNKLRSGLIKYHSNELSIKLSISPFLSLDKIVIPQHDRTCLFKVCIFMFISWITSYLLKFGFKASTVPSSRQNKNVFTSISQLISSGFNKIKETFQPNNNVDTNSISNNSLDLKTWQTSTLSKIVPLNQQYTLLEFDLPNKKSVEFEIDIGQELQACFLDENGKALVGNILPLTRDDSKYKFSCLLKMDSGVSFNYALSNLSVGDEIAIKKGKRQLSQSAKYCDPIEYITLVSSSLGISPSLSLLQSIRDESSSVEGLTFIWINKDKSDFVCDDKVQKLEDQSNGKIKAHRFINSNMNDLEMLYTDDMIDLIQPYERGNVIMLCGSQDFTDLMKNAFSQYGYSKENILTINAE